MQDKLFEGLEAFFGQLLVEKSGYGLRPCSIDYSILETLLIDLLRR